MSSISASLSGLMVRRDEIAQASNNIANSDTDGFKSFYYDCATLMNENGVRAYQGMTMGNKGALTYTGIATDVSVDSTKGMFVVQDKNTKSTSCVTTGSFRENINGDLEYLGQYLLMGLKYNTDGSLPAYDSNLLTPVAISYDPSTPVASTEAKLHFNLDSELLATGQASFVISPNISGGKLDNFITNPNLSIGDGFVINTEKADNTIKEIKCIYGGLITSSQTVVDIRQSTTTDIKITYNGVTTHITKGDIVANANNNNEVLMNLAAKLDDIGLRAKVNTAGTRIIIAPQNTTNDSLSISGDLSDFIEITTTILPLKEDGVRFASMGDLAKGLKSFNIKQDANSDAIIVQAAKNTKTVLANLQVAADTLSIFGLTSGPIPGQGYDPYDSTVNMASGNTAPDVVQTGVFYDSKGGANLLTIAMKKVTDGWIQETYMANPEIISKVNNAAVRPDGLLQVTKYTFDTFGKISNATNIQPINTASVNVSTPFTDLAANGGSVTVNGIAFTYSATPVQPTNFNSLAGLAAAINTNITINTAVKAMVVQGANNIYNLKLIPLNANVTVDSSVTNITFKQQAALSSVKDTLVIDFDPAVYKDGSVEEIKLKFNSGEIGESAVSQMSGTLTMDGLGVGILTNIEISGNGDLVGIYDNGAMVNLYKIPLAVFKNQNKLDASSGNNLFKQTMDSGKMEIVAPGGGGSGNIVGGNMESSNVDVATELTRVMQSQQGYSASTKTLSVGLSLIDTLLKNF